MNKIDKLREEVTNIEDKMDTRQAVNEGWNPFGKKEVEDRDIFLWHAKRDLFENAKNELMMEVGSDVTLGDLKLKGDTKPEDAEKFYRGYVLKLRNIMTGLSGEDAIKAREVFKSSTTFKKIQDFYIAAENFLIEKNYWQNAHMNKLMEGKWDRYKELLVEKNIGHMAEATSEEEQERIKMNFNLEEEGGKGTLDGSISDIDVAMKKTVGTYYTEATDRTVPISKLIGREISKKISEASTLAMMTAFGSSATGSIDVKAYAELQGKVGTLSRIGQQLDRAKVMITSSDQKTKLEGLNMLRNLSLDMTSIDKEKTFAANVGLLLQASQYAMTMDGNIINMEGNLEGINTVLSKLYKDMKSMDSVKDEEFDDLKRRISATLAILGTNAEAL